MKFLIFAIIAMASVVATAKEATTCVDLSGVYELPKQRHQRTDAPNYTMKWDQDKCHHLDVFVNKGGVVPIGPGYDLDGSDGWHAVKDTWVEKRSDSWVTAHGECETNSVIFSLDAELNLVASYARVFNCEDKFKGPLKETYKRLK